MSYGYLIDNDKIIINRDHIMYHAKNMVSDSSDSYKAPEIESFKLPGSAGRLLLMFRLRVWLKQVKLVSTML